MLKLRGWLAAPAFLIFFASVAYSEYLEYHRPLFPRSIAPYTVYWKGAHAVIYVTNAEYSIVHAGFIISTFLIFAVLFLTIALRIQAANQRERRG